MPFLRVPSLAAVLASFSLLPKGALATIFPGCSGGTLNGCPGTANCSVRYFRQNIDHFNWAPPLGRNTTTFLQRLFVNEQWWRPGGPIFFYFGNEDNVELYVNHSGLMWENAAEFQALLVFAEHRYYGKSMPFSPGVDGCMSWLTTEQALADFAVLIDSLQATYGSGRRLPVVGFGGSYGGMMAAWFRMKYPQSVDGVIAGSAPIWSFDGLDPPYDFNAFNTAVTFDASKAGGASDKCHASLKEAWPRILAASRSEKGRELLTRSFRTCAPIRPPDETSDDGLDIVQWAEGPWANMAMGNYPYPSSYLMHGESLLPAWPVRAACRHLEAANAADDASLFEAVREAAATQYNNTGTATCFNTLMRSGKVRMMRNLPERTVWRGKHVSTSPNTDCKGTWDYQWCTEMVQPFTMGTPKDMFYCPNGTFHRAVNCSHWDFEAEAARCETMWGVRPRKNWARVGLSSKQIQATSNIVFSNGLQDPWHGGGVLHNISNSVVAVVIKNGAHHIDLMFTDPADAAYPDIVAARNLERSHMRRWVDSASRRGVEETLYTV